MDPCLEDPALWPGVHSRLIAAIDEHLSAVLPPQYYVEVEERAYISDSSDLEFIGMPVPDRVRELYLEVRKLPGDAITAAIEVLSPTNKRPGAGRAEYEAKRRTTLGTVTHLVEIDLLRGGEPFPAHPRNWPADAPLPGDYRILVARGDRRPWADLYAFTVRDSIPPFSLPLHPGVEAPVVDLQALMARVYDRSRYRGRLDYQQAAVPTLRGEDAAWANSLLREHGLR